MVIASYLIAALVVTYPLVLHFDSAVVSHWNLDIQHSLWINWLFGVALDSSELKLFQTTMTGYPHVEDRKNRLRSSRDVR